MTFHHIPKPPRIIAPGGPVSAAIRAMRADEPASDWTRLHALRKAISDRIEADLALLDAIDGDPDYEPWLGSPNWGDQTGGYVGDGSDREDGDDNGIADDGGDAEQHGNVWFGCKEELSSIDGHPLCWVDGMLVSDAHA